MSTVSKTSRSSNKKFPAKGVKKTRTANQLGRGQIDTRKAPISISIKCGAPGKRPEFANWFDPRSKCDCNNFSGMASKSVAFFDTTVSELVKKHGVDKFEGKKPALRIGAVIGFSKDALTMFGFKNANIKQKGSCPYQKTSLILNFVGNKTFTIDYLLDPKYNVGSINRQEIANKGIEVGDLFPRNGCIRGETLVKCLLFKSIDSFKTISTDANLVWKNHPNSLVTLNNSAAVAFLVGAIREISYDCSTGSYVVCGESVHRSWLDPLLTFAVSQNSNSTATMVAATLVEIKAIAELRLKATDQQLMEIEQSHNKILDEKMNLLAIASEQLKERRLQRAIRHKEAKKAKKLAKKNSVPSPHELDAPVSTQPMAEDSSDHEPLIREVPESQTRVVEQDIKLSGDWGDFALQDSSEFSDN